MTTVKMTILQKDLANNARDRLNNWLNDTRMRCNAVDESSQFQVSLVLSTLLYVATALAAGVKVPLPLLLDTIAELYLSDGQDFVKFMSEHQESHK